MEKKMYAIEKTSSDYYGTINYRFYSLYNGTRGGWTTKEKAIAEGEWHEQILLFLHGKSVSTDKTTTL